MALTSADGYKKRLSHLGSDPLVRTSDVVQLDVRKSETLILVFRRNLFFS